MYMKDIVNSGARIIGGCCGTTPEYIKCTYDSLKAKTSNLYFVKDTIELKEVLDNIIN